MASVLTRSILRGRPSLRVASACVRRVAIAGVHDGPGKVTKAQANTMLYGGVLAAAVVGFLVCVAGLGSGFG